MSNTQQYLQNELETKLEQLYVLVDLVEMLPSFVEFHQEMDFVWRVDRNLEERVFHRTLQCERLENPICRRQLMEIYLSNRS